MYYTTAVSPQFNSSTQIIPTPQISMVSQINYASESNQIVVGHNYIMTITGNATSYRDTNQTLSFGGVIDHINLIRKLFSKMGGTLYLRDEDNNDIIIAKGGKLISCNFNPSNNNWKTFANYTIEIEFQSIDYVGEQYNCAYSVLDSSLSTKAIDLNLYKLKSYNENHEINLIENFYNRIRTLDTDNDADTENMSMSFVYTIDAVGKNFFVENKLIPAWEHAKNFVQFRLNEVSTKLFLQLGITSPQACGASRTINTIHSDIPPFDLANLLGAYKIFNEEISTNISESDGSFSSTYKCILKRNKISKYTTGSCLHNFNKEITYDNNQQKIVNININGTMQGLIEGGLFNNQGTFTIPTQGNFIVAGGGSGETKYNNAINNLNLILNEEKDDLSDSFKKDIGVTFSGLNIEDNTECINQNDTPKAINFNLTHNPFEGTINYGIQYSSINACGDNGEYNDISISVNNPTKVYATFELPGVNSTAGTNVGTILQDLGTTTSRTIDVTIQGKNDIYKSCDYSMSNINDIFLGLCNDIVLPSGIENNLPDPNLYVLTKKTQNVDPSRGSYTINLGYICNPGCLT
jgi:hypothetical protein